MSILLPPDDPNHPPARTAFKKGRASPSFFEWLKKTGFWNMSLKPVNPDDSSEHRAPAGKIRLVTSRWVDRPTRISSSKTIKYR